VPVIAELLAAHPQIDVRLGLSDRIASLAEEGIDVAIRVGVLPDSALRAVRLGAVRMIACASPAYLERRGTPRDPAALARPECIAFAGTTPIAERWAFAGKAGGRERSVKVRARLAVDTAPAAIEAALAGAGIARVLSYQVDHLIAKGRLRAVLERYEPSPRPVHLVHLPGAPVRLAAAFAALATTRLRARLAPT
jgi:DNA-binding transcriptional LysR family regulator